jgi:hypothetical protein
MRARFRNPGLTAGFFFHCQPVKEEGLSYELTMPP